MKTIRKLVLLVAVLLMSCGGPDEIVYGVGGDVGAQDVLISSKNDSTGQVALEKSDALDAMTAKEVQDTMTEGVLVAQEDATNAEDGQVLADIVSADRDMEDGRDGEDSLDAEDSSDVEDVKLVLDIQAVPDIFFVEDIQISEPDIVLVEDSQPGLDIQIPDIQKEDLVSVEDIEDSSDTEDSADAEDVFDTKDIEDVKVVLDIQTVPDISFVEDIQVTPDVFIEPDIFVFIPDIQEVPDVVEMVDIPEIQEDIQKEDLILTEDIEDSFDAEDIQIPAPDIFTELDVIVTPDIVVIKPFEAFVDNGDGTTTFMSKDYQYEVHFPSWVAATQTATTNLVLSGNTQNAIGLSEDDLMLVANFSVKVEWVDALDYISFIEWFSAVYGSPDEEVLYQNKVLNFAATDSGGAFRRVAYVAVGDKGAVRIEMNFVMSDPNFVESFNDLAREVLYMTTTTTKEVVK